MSAPDVTVVMSPRERFNFTRQSLESLYAQTAVSFNLICIDGGSPPKVRDYLKQESVRRGFKLIRTSHYLAPNEARNLAFDLVDTKYVVFVDNDVIYGPQWLEHMLNCLEETGASVVGPVICIGNPVHTKIHMAGGDAHFVVKDGQRRFYETHNFLDQRLPDVRDQLTRTPSELAEFHCMLVRTDMWKRVGRLDENLKATFEHVDFCMAVRAAGGSVVIEPQAVITYTFEPESIALDEVPFFLCRWSDAWSLGAERHFHKKWNSVCDDKVHREFVTWHRHNALPRLRKTIRAVIGWRRSEWLFDRMTEVISRRVERSRPATTIAPIPEDSAQQAKAA